MHYKIGLVVDLESRYGIDVLRGACRIGHLLHWEISFARQPWSMSDQKPFPRSFDGVIGYFDPITARRLDQAGIRHVNLKAHVDSPPPPVGINEEEVGACAARHLIDQGLTNLAVVATTGMGLTARRRIAGFRTHALEANATYHEFFPAVEQAEAILGLLVPWLKSLPVPSGVFGIGDYYANLVLTACRDAHIPVPERIAVVGADNDPIRCMLAAIPLSSLAMPHEELGAAAAQHMHFLLTGNDINRNRFLLPGPVIIRASSDIKANSDPVLAQVSLFIREHLSDNLSIQCIANAVGSNRRTLERRFRQVLRRTIHEEIRRLRIQRGMELLIDNNLPISAVAVSTGLSHNAFIKSFQMMTGSTPMAWRQARQALTIKMPSRSCMPLDNKDP